MSRYKIDSDKYSISVGYDQPLRTFFAIVENTHISENEDSLILWVGTAYDEIKSVEKLQAEIADYAILTDEVLHNLKVDARQPFNPSSLQASVEHFCNADKDKPLDL